MLLLSCTPGGAMTSPPRGEPMDVEQPHGSTGGAHLSHRTLGDLNDEILASAASTRSFKATASAAGKNVR